MRQPEQVRAFKSDLSTYLHKVDQARKLKEIIEDCYYQLGGVKGVDPSKEPIHSPPNKDIEYAIRDKITRLDQKLARVCAQIDEIREILNNIEKPLRTAVFDVYARGKTIRSVAIPMHLSETGLRKRMNKAIEKALID